MPPYAATSPTPEARIVTTNELAPGIVRSWRATLGAARVANAGSGPVYMLRPDAAAPIPSPQDAFEALLEDAEADTVQSAALAQGRQWVAQAFYQGEHRTLAALRLAAGLSQRQLGQRCSLGQQHISRYESGKHKPSLDTAHGMARALGVDLDTYFAAWQATVATAATAGKT